MHPFPVCADILSVLRTLYSNLPQPQAALLDFFEALTYNVNNQSDKLEFDEVIVWCCIL